jgi:hypothetical protein
MKHWTSEIVNVCWEDDEMTAIEYRNSHLKRYMLKPATKQDDATLLDIEIVK